MKNFFLFSLLFSWISCSLLSKGSLSQDRCPSYPDPIPIPNIDNNPPIQGTLKQIDQMISDFVASDKVPGFVCVIVYDQQIIFGKGYGKSNYFDPKSSAPTLDTITRVASISKTFTDAMLFQLRDKGVVDLDDPVVKFLPTFSVKNPYKTNRNVTLRELASHTSGLPREIPCPWEEYSTTCTEPVILKALAKQYLLMPQYFRAHYSNLGIALLGRTLERAASQNFESYQKQNILNPLGMTASSFLFQDINSTNLATGVMYLNNGTAVPAPIENLGWGNPMAPLFLLSLVDLQGGLFASSSDMAQFMSFLFRTNQPMGSNQIFDGQTVLEFLKPAILTHDGTAGFGTPWEFNYTAKHWVASKAGELNGYRSQIALVPELKLGVFTTAFVTDVDDPTVLSIPIVDALVPVFDQVLDHLQPAPPVPANYKLFLGSYVNTHDNSDVTKIYMQNGVLMADSQGSSFIVTPFSEDPLALRINLAHPEGYSCRGLDDGMENELIYFSLNSQNDHAQSVMIMGELYTYVKS